MISLLVSRFQILQSVLLMPLSHLLSPTFNVELSTLKSIISRGLFYILGAIYYRTHLPGSCFTLPRGLYTRSAQGAFRECLCSLLATTAISASPHHHAVYTRCCAGTDRTKDVSSLLRNPSRICSMFLDSQHKRDWIEVCGACRRECIRGLGQKSYDSIQRKLQFHVHLLKAVASPYTSEKINIQRYST
ncbi:hypothetical protein BT96DRAFT_511075 [Gymnopus androsaceus JB14]|uniref:Uncharacterized protein n=1 Tax=Gymnopus androsaceus JB14 TaxID=1447944 RepID=A0A6A4HUU3_9AGAR|nr:hypothetical protein BT96DRAFT_511075 [Gymnopus androsaceus JB14]